MPKKYKELHSFSIKHQGKVQLYLMKAMLSSTYKPINHAQLIAELHLTSLQTTTVY